MTLQVQSLQNNSENRNSGISEFTVIDTFPQHEKNPDQTQEIKEISKIRLSAFVFIANIIAMLFYCHVCLYYFFAPNSDNEIKGMIAGVSIGVACLITIPTLLYLASVKKILQLAFLMDTIMLATVSGVLAFVSMILIFDKGGKWYFLTIQVSFSFCIFFYSTIVRVFLVTLDWQKWKLIVFKLHLMANALMFFISGVYFIWVDFTYTRHRLKAFDEKVHDFMLLFIFTMFGLAYEFYGKVTDLDRTGELRYVYRMKNMDETHPQKKKEIIRNKRESMHSIRLLGQNEDMRKAVKEYKASRFANIMHMEEADEVVESE